MRPSLMASAPSRTAPQACPRAIVPPPPLTTRNHVIADDPTIRPVDRRVEHGGCSMLRQSRIVAVEYQEIGAATRGDGPDRLGQRPCAAGERPLVKTEPAGFAIAHENVAFLEREPLCRVDETQLEKRIDADVTVTADAQVSARGQVVDRREDAVAEIGF